jgi:hypothetical protein
VGKEREAGGLVQKGSFPFLLPFDSRTEKGSGGLGRWRSAGPPGTAADDEMGKRERVTRGFFPHPHLGLRWSVGAAPREGAAAGVPLRRCSGAAALEGSGERVRCLWRCEVQREAARGYL